MSGMKKYVTRIPSTPDDGGDDERPALAEMVFDGEEDLRANCAAGLADRGTDPVACPAYGGGV